MGSSPPVFENRRALRARSSRRVDFPTPRAAFPDGVTKLPILREKLGRFGGGLRQIRVDRLMQLREDKASAFSEARGAPSRSIIREHEVTSSTVVSPMPFHTRQRLPQEYGGWTMERMGGSQIVRPHPGAMKPRVNGHPAHMIFTRRIQPDDFRSPR